MVVGDCVFVLSEKVRVKPAVVDILKVSMQASHISMCGTLSAMSHCTLYCDAFVSSLQVSTYTTC